MNNFLQELFKKDYVKNNKRILALLKELETDIQRSFYTVVVLGEFKRGKSTFVNALLGTPLLPMDILPETATINAIMYSDNPRVSVMTKSGEEVGELTAEFLKKFSAQLADTSYLNQVRYIKIGYPIELLKNRIVLVDTPGVYDLSEQRTEITYSFIPKANTVIFLLDANSPLKKTEKDFIEDNLIPLGITDILFLLNKYDEVDEEEDADLLDDVKNKISNAFNVEKSNAALRKAECLPISSRDALEGIVTSNKKLIEFSGLNAVHKKLAEMLESSQLEAKKQATYKSRLIFILDYLSRELSNVLTLKLADSAELQNAIDELEKLMAEQSTDDTKITDYAMDTKNKIYAIIDKSVNFFHNKLEEEICESIENYNHENFKEFVEVTVTKSIKKNFENWIMVYAPSVEKLLKMLEIELARGLSYHFKQKITISTAPGEFRLEQLAINFSVEDVSDVNLKAGAAAAAGSLGLMAIAGAGVLPLIGFVAMPYLKKKMLTKRLAQVKSLVIPDVKNFLIDSVSNLKSELHKYVDNRCNLIVENTKFAYDKILNDMHSVMQKEIDLKKSTNCDTQQDADIIRNAISEISALKNKIN